MQYVASQVRHRQTMHDLHGINAELTLLGRAHVTPTELGRVMSLQSGAFSDWNQAKFDPPKNGVCQRCLAPNTQMHWLQCPAHAHLRQEMDETFASASAAPGCLVHHLLVPRSPSEVEMKAYLMGIEDQTGHFHSEPGLGLQNLFSDGSFCSEHPIYLGVRAWSLINATTGMARWASTWIGPNHHLCGTLWRTSCTEMGINLPNPSLPLE